MDGGFCHYCRKAECVCPDVLSELTQEAHALSELTAERDKYHAALSKINRLRDDIVARQSFGFSSHVYPIVTILAEAGFEGLGYEDARARAMSHDAQIAILTKACADALMFFTNLEEGTGLDDPLRQLRTRYHRPITDQLKEAIKKGNCDEITRE